MSFRRRTSFTGIQPAAVKELIGLQDDVARDILALRGEAIGATTDTKTANYSARFNERIRVIPPAAGCALTFPGAEPKNQNKWIEVLKLGGGPLTVRGTSGLIQGAASLVLTTAGFYYFQTDGTTGWWIQPSGSGGISDGVYGSITVSGGGTIFRVTDGVYGGVTVSGGGLIWTPTGGSALTLLTTEKNLGSVPTFSGSFTIAGAGMTIGKPVLIQQAVGPYTGKGTLADEAEDQVTASASVTSAVLITAYWRATESPIVGNVKFNYAVSA